MNQYSHMGFFMKIFFIPAHSSFPDDQVKKSIPEMERTNKVFKKTLIFFTCYCTFYSLEYSK